MSDYLYPDPDLKVCFHCKYFVYAIALGQGLRCSHKANSRVNGTPGIIKSRYDFCTHFQRRNNVINNDNFKISSDSLIKLNKLINQWAIDAGLEDEEPSSITVNFTFTSLGRCLSVQQDGSDTEFPIEEFEG